MSQQDSSQDYEDQDSEATSMAPGGERPQDHPSDEAAPESQPTDTPGS